jgi:hypothetical protein
LNELEEGEELDVNDDEMQYVNMLLVILKWLLLKVVPPVKLTSLVQKM